MRKILFLLVSLIICAISVQSESLKILSINVWSGLDYHGNFSMGEYETDSVRELRFKGLVLQLKEQNPDVVFIQEANPVAFFSSKLADSLGYDEIHQTCNSGIKFLGLGFPSNLNEGIAILAKKSLNLEDFKILKLNGLPGIYSDNFSLHFDESNFAIIAKIAVSGIPIYLINTHLISSPQPDLEIINSYRRKALENGLNSFAIDQSVHELFVKSKIRKNEIQEIIEFVKDLPDKSAVILGGDLNLPPNSSDYQLLTDSIFIDSFSDKAVFSWDPKLNTNTQFSFPDKLPKGELGYPYLESISDLSSKRLDYLLLNSKAFRKNDILSSKIVLNTNFNGVFPSDHFGVITEISLDAVKIIIPMETDNIVPYLKQNIDPLPIVSFDTDVGFGFGAKALLLNLMKANESFDMIVFGTTKGELWTRFAFSMPHYELRQGKIYPVSIDFAFDYDRYLKYSYFGIGNSSRFDSREFYTKEIMQFNLNLSRGITKELVLNGGASFMNIRNYNLADTSRMKLLSHLNSSKVDYISVFTNFRYDSRNSFINPSKGFVAQFDAEYSPSFHFNNVSFGRLGIWLQDYITLFFPTTVLATRFGVQGLIGDDLPIQVLLPIGGNKNLRGYPQDRFLDKISSVCNIELRFPIYWRIGGIAGIDAGKVWNKPDKMDLKNWASNYVLGLRGYMNTFVIRADFGISKETTGIYLNFGHIF